MLTLTCAQHGFVPVPFPFVSWQIGKSFWIEDGGRRIELDTSRLYEQFAVENLGTPGAIEPSNIQHIMLNEKIAHNFSEYLRFGALSASCIRPVINIIYSKVLK